MIVSVEQVIFVNVKELALNKICSLGSLHVFFINQGSAYRPMHNCTHIQVSMEALE